MFARSGEFEGSTRERIIALRCLPNLCSHGTGIINLCDHGEKPVGTRKRLVRVAEWMNWKSWWLNNATLWLTKR